MPDYDSLLTCPLDTPMTISRVSDQDREFLQFAERHELRPGDVVRVEERNAAGDSVLLRGRNDRLVTIGARAASKVLVQTAKVIAFLLLLSGVGFAQTPAPAEPAAEPFKIMDNSFLVEEAFNQPDGVFQNIVGVVRLQGEWGAAFTQEWPVGSQAHQFSYTLAWLDAGQHRGVGDVLINYRYQASMEGPGRPAFSPRISLVVPAGDSSRGLGSGSAGLQFNLPFSKQTGDWYWHWNAGTTWLPQAEASLRAGRRLDNGAARQRRLAVPRRQRDLPAAPHAPPHAGIGGHLRRDRAGAGDRPRDELHAVAGIPRRMERRRQADHRRLRGANHVERATRSTPARSFTSRTSCPSSGRARSLIAKRSTSSPRSARHPAGAAHVRRCTTRTTTASPRRAR